MPLQIVLPFIAPEVAGNLMATACWANAQQILLISVCVSIHLCLCECMNVWQPKPFALHVATFELGSVLQPLCSTNKCHFQRPIAIPTPFSSYPSRGTALRPCQLQLEQNALTMATDFISRPKTSCKINGECLWQINQSVSTTQGTIKMSEIGGKTKIKNSHTSLRVILKYVCKLFSVSWQATVNII